MVLAYLVEQKRSGICYSLGQTSEKDKQIWHLEEAAPTVFTIHVVYSSSGLVFAHRTTSCV
jgi:hypothetical protein